MFLIFRSNCIKVQNVLQEMIHMFCYPAHKYIVFTFHSTSSSLSVFTFYYAPSMAHHISFLVIQLLFGSLFFQLS